MATNKIISANARTHNDLRSCIRYVMREEKTKDNLMAVTGPFEKEEITPDNVLDAFLEEKKNWNKDYGRMYMHSVLSFHKDEYITPQEAFDFGMKLAEDDPFYNGFQTLVAVHQERDHLHVHFVTNSVSYLNGNKEHHNAKDIKALMKRTNELCLQQGLVVNEKGKHFEGNDILEGEFSTFSNNEYRMDKGIEAPWKKDIYQAVIGAVNKSNSREDFISYLKRKGITTNWSDERKHITFSDKKGNKVRAATLAKTYHTGYLETKEKLQGRIERNAQQYNVHITVPKDMGRIAANTTGIASQAVLSLSNKQKEEYEKNNTQHL